MVEGVGLHTGARTRVVFRPVTEATGLRFRRLDLPGAPTIPVRVGQVADTERRTSLGSGTATIHTVEHLLAAVAVLGLSDLDIEIDGPEPPIFDGSFEPYLDALEGAGFRALDGEIPHYTISRPLTVTSGTSRYEVLPGGSFRLEVSITWDHPLIGTQAGAWEVNPGVFRAELARARTFGFLHEVEALRARGLLQGGSSASAVLLDEQAVVNGPLRWPDEFVRHKAGDIIGDLALLGGTLAATIRATRPSHQGNLALAREILRTANRTGTMSMDISRILEVIPHRYPFLLVDRIVEVIGGKKIVGLKNVTINEPFFQGHFPGHPIMPGVLIVETMAQVGGFLLLDSVEDVHNKVVYFMSMDGVKFRKPVVPGDQLRLEVEMLQFRGKTCRMRGEAFVDGTLVCEAEMMAAVVDR
jgi:UDP-3-O-[3-hydroxymyristoyl] N-acetylglucosamine deacetylase/3-hydroxyacyl-[acyl-carrier-protein] dehydratase